MAGRPVLELRLGPADRRELERLSREAGEPVATRARIILCRAEGLSQLRTARVLGCSVGRVARWCLRFRNDGIKTMNEPPSRQSPGPPSLQEISGPRGDEFTATVRTVAAAAGVSAMTVSRILRGQGRARTDTRQRVLDAARAQAYQPDPSVNKLMTHLRKRRSTRLQASICALVSTRWSGGGRYYQRVLTGARSRASKLGFVWDEFPLHEMLSRPRRAVRILQSRGVQGILLPPTVEHSVRLPDAQYWKDFSVIAASYTVDAPVFNRVVPDQFRNIQTLCHALYDQGHRRIGFGVWRHLDERAQFHYSGGYGAFHTQMGISPLPVPVLQDPDTYCHLPDWFRRTRPDAIIAADGGAAMRIGELLGLPNPGPVTLAAIHLLGPDDCLVSGIDQFPDLVGARAIDRLARMITRDERGVPAQPSVTMIEGRWHNGFGGRARTKNTAAEAPG